MIFLSGLHKVVIALNNDFINRMMGGYYVSYSSIFIRYNLNVSITEYIDFINGIHTLLPEYSRQYFFKIYDSQSKLVFSEKEVLTIIYNFIFLNDPSNPFSITYEKGSLWLNPIRGFLKNKLEYKFDKFILFFYENHPYINSISYLRILLTLKKIGWSFPITSYSTYPIGVQHTVFRVLFEGIVYTKNLDENYYDFYLFDLLENIEDQELKDRLANKSFEFISDVNEEENQRKKAFIILLLTDDGDLLNLLLEDLKKNQKNNIKTTVNEALLNLDKKLRRITRVFEIRFLSDYLKFLLENDLSNENLIYSLLKSVKNTTSELNKIVIEFSNTNELNLYHSISFFASNKSEEAINFLIQKLDSHYAPWCLGILYNIDIKYYFKYINKLSLSIASARMELRHFGGFKDSLTNLNPIRKVLFLCDEHLLRLYYGLLNSEVHLKKMQEFDDFPALRREIEKRVMEIKTYREQKTQLT